MIGDAISGAYEVFKNGYAGPRCLVHGDFRPDNMMFATPAGGRPVAVLDWQSYGLGCCMADVSYFMAGALPSQARRAHEEDLLRGYHAALVRLGVDDYGFERLRADYARHAFALFNMAFIASMIVGRTPRGDEMFFAMLEGGADMVMDHGALDILAAQRAGR
jgi:thiamine kinase-like enzyme